MPLTQPYYRPQLSYGNNTLQPPTRLVTPQQGAAWNADDIVVLATTGSITSPPGNGTGALAGIAGPATSAITVAGYAVTGAPAQAYWIIVAYSNSGGTAISQPSQEIYYQAAAGYVPAVTVSTTGEPSSSGYFQTYIGTLPGTEALQNTQSSPTALGSAYDAAYPLANSQGANQGATNQSGNILGLAQSPSTSTFGAFPGGAYVPSDRAYGSTSDFPPLAQTNELFQLYVIDLSLVNLEMSLSQSYGYYQTLVGTEVGLNLAAATGGGYVFIADPSQSNKVARIVDLATGVPPLIISNATATSGTALGPGPTGSYGDFGGRVIVEFLSSALLG